MPWGVCCFVDPGLVALAIAETMARVPGLRVSVEVALCDVVDRRLLAGEFDAAILASVEIGDDRFKVCQIDSDHLVVAFATDHRLADAASVPVEALGEELSIIRFGCPHDEALARVLDQRGIRRIVGHRVDDPRWLAAFVRQGQGCSVMPATLARVHGLAHRRIEGGDLCHRTMLATVPGRPHSPALATLLRQICGRATG